MSAEFIAIEEAIVRTRALPLRPRVSVGMKFVVFRRVEPDIHFIGVWDDSGRQDPRRARDWQKDSV
jgi:hypothetical protein